MIQRIQSLFLALAALWAITIIIVNPVLLSLTASNAVYELKNLGLFTMGVGGSQMNTYPLIIALALCLVVPAFAIFKFRDRKFQMKIVRLCTIVQLAYVVLVVFYIDRANTLIGEETDVAASPWVYTVLIAIVSSFLANRFIKKDDNLIRAADRLR